MDGRSEFGSTPAILSFTSSQRCASVWSPKRNHVHQVPDVGDYGVAEHQGLAVPVLVQRLRDPLDRFCQPAVEIAHGVAELFLYVALDARFTRSVSSEASLAMK